MHDTDKYVTDGRIDIEAIENDGHGVNEWCKLCGEPNPCSLAWAADRAGRFRARAARVNWDRVMGITSLVCAVLIVGSWLVNPATLPW